MGQDFPTKNVYTIGDGANLITRRAVSYTPSAAMTLRHFSFVAVRLNSDMLYYLAPSALDEVDKIEWEIRAAAAGAHKPGTADALASGTFDWRYTSSWKLGRPIKFTINLSAGLELNASTEYWFVLKMKDDNDFARYPLGWYSTYDTGADGEVSASVYSSSYTIGAGWATGSNTYNLSLTVLDDQAGDRWHVVIDGKGYMQPDKMRGYKCEQVASGLAQSRGGQSEYSQLRYPYSAMSQNDWTSGSGQLVQDDPNAFLYSMGLDTTVPHQMIIGPYVHLTGVDNHNPYYEPTAVAWRHLPDHALSVNSSANYVAQKFTVSVDGNIACTSVGIRVAREPWQRQHYVAMALYTDDAGSPGTIIGAWATLSPTYKWQWRDAAITTTLTADTSYWVVVKTDQAWGKLSEYRLMYDQTGSYAGGPAKYSFNGLSWSVMTGASMVFRINYGIAGALNGDVVKLVYGKVGDSDSLYAAAGKKVYCWNNAAGSWEDLSVGIEGEGYDTTTDNITDMIIFNNKLWVAQGYSHNARALSPTAWSDAGYAWKYFHIGRGYMWASSSVNTVMHSNDGVTWSANVTVGEGLFEITAMTNYQGRLLVGKEDGIWEVDDQDLAREYLIFREHADPDNCKGWTVWSGMLFIPVQASIWRWQGSQYREVGPTDKRSGPTSAWPNVITRMTSTAPLLFATTAPVVSTGFGGLLAYNGMGWHHITHHTRTNRTSYTVFVTTEVGTNQTRIWYAEGDRICYVILPTFTNNRYDWELSDYSLFTGSYVGSWWDGGLKDALKFWNRLTMIADIPDKTSIEVYCARDGEDWNSVSDMIYLGELFPHNLTDNGEYVLMFPDGMVAKSIQLVFNLNTRDSTKTPRIKAYNVEALVRQPPAYTYSFRVLLANNITKMDTGTESARNANDMWEELTRAAAKNAPVIISFPYKSIRGCISYLREETYQFKPDGMEEEIWERVAVVSVIEAT